MKNENKPIVRLKNVTKAYEDTIALQDVDLTINEGIFGLIGPNGAGKTTMIKLILGLTTPTTGEVSVFGKSPRAHPSVFNSIGWCSEKQISISTFTPREYLTKFLNFYDWQGDRKARVSEIAQEFSLSAFLDRKNETLSMGMLQRLKLARTFIHKPQFVLLDEPSRGINLFQRDEILHYIKAYAKDNRTILYSSHILSEVEKICEEVIFLYNSHLIAHGSISNIRKKLSQIPLRIRIEAKGDLNSFLPQIITKKYVTGVNILGQHKEARVIEITTRDPDQFLREIPAVLLSTDLELEQFEIYDEDLPSLYHYLKREAVALYSEKKKNGGERK